jgi:ATP-dependent DNA helicase RecG
LSATVYRATGDKAAYTRQAGFTALQNEQLVLNYVRQHGRIRRVDVMLLCRLSEGQAKDLIKKLKSRGELLQHGDRRAAYDTSAA